MMNITLQITGRVQRLVEIRVMRLHSCRLQYNWIDQMCSHNQDSIEICSAQQVEAGRELLYTETGSSEHTHWRVLTGSRSHAGPHIDNVTLPITLLCQLTGDFVSVLSSRSNLELPVERSVTMWRHQDLARSQYRNDYEEFVWLAVRSFMEEKNAREYFRSSGIGDSEEN